MNTNKLQELLKEYREGTSPFPSYKQLADIAYTKMDVIDVSINLLQHISNVMEANWYQIDNEWGTGQGDLDKAIVEGSYPELAELRTILVVKAQG